MPLSRTDLFCAAAALTPARLAWQLDQLAAKGVSGVNGFDDYTLTWPGSGRIPVELPRANPDMRGLRLGYAPRGGGRRQGYDLVLSALNRPARVHSLDYNGSVGSLARDGKLHLAAPRVDPRHAWVYKLTGVE